MKHAHDQSLLLHEDTSGDVGKQSRTRAPSSSLNERARRQLLAAGGLCILFMIGEIVGGYLAGSLAIMTECV